MDILSLFKNSLGNLSGLHNRIYNLFGTSAALLLALENGPFVAVEQDDAKAENLVKDINFFRKMLSHSPVLFMPDPEGAEASGKRAQTILSAGENGSLVTSSKNLTTPVWDRQSLEADSFLLRKGASIDRQFFEDWLVSLGYRNVPMVIEKGEYSQRGWIIDVFPSTSADPVRIEFFGDEIETVRAFDVGTQRSKDDIPELLLLPANEPEAQTGLAAVFQDRKFFCLYPATDMEGFPQNTVRLSRFAFEFDAAPGESAEAEHAEPVAGFDAGMRSIKGYGILPEERKGLIDLALNLKALSEKYRIMIIASSQGQGQRLKDILRDHDVIAPYCDVQDLISFGARVSITVGELSSGIFLDNLMIITERDLFGARPSYRPMKKSKVADLIVSMDDITPGDFVIHRDHGIGRFTGTAHQKVDENEIELMAIDYVDGRLYVPVQGIGIISKYRAEEGIVPHIDKLGGKTWEKKKARARKKVHDMAEKLLALYADRRVVRGFSFSPDTDLHKEFDSFFSYEETPDQMKAINDIKRDMESERPMDRLVCGDVGYGKTEVAMRAAFKAVYDNRQVSVLVPTTILAEQHCRTFKERFSGFPVKIDFISRFKTRREIDAALKGVEKGEIDIIIGTHGLLSKKLSLNRPGLLIVDEEHRFGVGQKERIKEMSKDIDVLTLTATPIPRTLHMALSGIREISVIETPPEERLAVKSVVTMFNDALIRDVISKELLRNGQVFFVHNRIRDIYKIGSQIRELVPDAKIEVAHGQMQERELENIMHRFFEGKTNVLISTNIIGAGIDIPTANTIIINMADKMGLADLYQLRGRVGRSKAKGYAYFLAPPESLLTEEARKRLQAVQEMSYLGAGFRLALKDLEIRGAGDLFGPEQSGHIQEIGFDLYIEMLEKAVAELKGIEIKEEFEPVIDLKISAFIPDEYIADVTLRLSFYRRIASLKSEKDISEIESELKDRFGKLPEALVNLLNIVRLKVPAKTLLITKLQEVKGKIQFIFSSGTTVQPQHIFDLQKTRKGKITFLPEGFEISMKGTSSEKVFAEINSAMAELVERSGMEVRD